MTPSEVAARTKAAAELVKSGGLMDYLPTPSGVASGAANLAGSVASLGLKGLAIPAAGGAAIGYGLSKINDDDFDVSDAKADEEIAEWRRAVDSLRRLQQQRSLAAA